MNIDHPERIWITAASEGLGHALAVDLLERGCHVAISGTLSEAQRNTLSRYSERLHFMQGDLLDDAQAAAARTDLEQMWGGLEGLVVNAGGCDYLQPGQAGTAIFEAMVSSQIKASANILQVALPLLKRGRKPWLMALVSPFTAPQLHEPSQPATASNNLSQVFENARTGPDAAAVDLMLVTPQPPKKTLPASVVLPQVWSPEEASQALVERLPERPRNLVLSTQAPHLLWPLPH